MISGSDIIIANPGRSVPEVLDAIVRTIQDRWPESIIQDGATGQRFASYSAVPFGALQELFVYRDESSFESWKLLGAHPTNSNAMIHALADDDEITLVVDDPEDQAIASIGRELTDFLSRGMPWEQQAA